MHNRTDQEILESARKTLQTEADALLALPGRLTNDFAHVIRLILQSGGRLVVAGIGKSALIAQKIVATLNSTGTAALFMHAADAIHGDLGMIQSKDVVLLISNSGNTPEIKVLAPLIRSNGNRLIAMTGNTESELARLADFVLSSQVDREACPINLAPTSSTTAQLALGDALAVSLLEIRGFTPDDFARYHPGGSLGKRLYLKVDDLYPHNEKPQVSRDADLSSVILEISTRRLGATAVVDRGKLVGMITDGDLRRMLQGEGDIRSTRASGIMNSSPKICPPDTMAVDALQTMKSFNINQLIVCDPQSGEYLGIVHIHDILREGIL